MSEDAKQEDMAGKTSEFLEKLGVPKEPGTEQPEKKDYTLEELEALVPKGGKLDLPEDVREDLENQGAAKRVEVPEAPQYDPEQTVPADQSDYDPWMRRFKDDIEVKVDDEEIAAFLRAAMNDREVELDSLVGPEGHRVLVRCRSLPTKALRAVFAALAADTRADDSGEGDSPKIMDEGLVATYYQYYCSLVQLVSISGEKCDWIPPDDVAKLSVDELAARMCEIVDETVAAMSVPKFTIAVTGLRIFEKKLAILKGGWPNGDFSDPAGGA